MDLAVAAGGDLIKTFNLNRYLLNDDEIER